MTTTDPSIDVPTSSVPLTGLGGWLIIPGMGLLLSPIWGAWEAFQHLQMLQTHYPEATARSEYLALLVIYCSSVAFTVFVAFKFFLHSSATKSLFPALLVFNVITAIIATSHASSLMHIENDPSASLGPFIYACVWIPYFFASRRVQNTFVI